MRVNPRKKVDTPEGMIYPGQPVHLGRRLAEHLIEQGLADWAPPAKDPPGHYVWVQDDVPVPLVEESAPVAVEPIEDKNASRAESGIRPRRDG